MSVGTHSLFDRWLKCFSLCMVPLESRKEPKRRTIVSSITLTLNRSWELEVLVRVPVPERTEAMIKRHATRLHAVQSYAFWYVYEEPANGAMQRRSSPKDIFDDEKGSHQECPSSVRDPPMFVGETLPHSTYICILRVQQDGPYGTYHARAGVKNDDLDICIFLKKKVI